MSNFCSQNIRDLLGMQCPAKLNNQLLFANISYLFDMQCLPNKFSWHFSVVSGQLTWQSIQGGVNILNLPIATRNIRTKHKMSSFILQYVKLRKNFFWGGGEVGSSPSVNVRTKVFLIVEIAFKSNGKHLLLYSGLSFIIIFWRQIQENKAWKINLISLPYFLLWNCAKSTGHVNKDRI